MTVKYLTPEEENAELTALVNSKPATAFMYAVEHWDECRLGAYLAPERDDRMICYIDMPIDVVTKLAGEDE